jgi:hypothetical protein
MNVAIESLRIKKLHVFRYPFKKATINQGAFTAVGSINDPNIISDFDVSGNIEKEANPPTVISTLIKQTCIAAARNR